MVYVVLIILTAHIFGDYFLQQFALFKMKRFDIWILLFHTVIWSTCISIGLAVVKRFAWWKFCFSLIVHTMIDYWKLHFNPYPTPFTILIMDQMLHMVQLYIVARRGKTVRSEK
jgi:hypothetical protein